MDDAESETPVGTTNYKSFSCTSTRPKTPTDNYANTTLTSAMATTTFSKNYDEPKSVHFDSDCNRKKNKKKKKEKKKSAEEQTTKKAPVSDESDISEAEKQNKAINSDNTGATNNAVICDETENLALLETNATSKTKETRAKSSVNFAHSQLTTNDETENCNLKSSSKSKRKKKKDQTPISDTRLESQSTHGNTLNRSKQKRKEKNVRNIVNQASNNSIVDGEAKKSKQVTNDDKSSYQLTTTNAAVDPSTYEGRGLVERFHGDIFELKCLLLCCINGITNEKYREFFVASNMKNAFDFDDIVFIHRNNIILIQAKHSKQDDIELDETHLTTEKGPISIRHYFPSYVKIREAIVAKIFAPSLVDENATITVILCNNFIFKDHIMKKYFKPIEEQQVSSLMNVNKELPIYQLKPKQSSKTIKKGNKQNSNDDKLVDVEKKTDTTAQTAEDLLKPFVSKDQEKYMVPFLENLIFVLNLTEKNAQLDDYLNTELNKLCQCENKQLLEPLLGWIANKIAKEKCTKCKFITNDICKDVINGLTSNEDLYYVYGICSYFEIIISTYKFNQTDVSETQIDEFIQSLETSLLCVTSSNERQSVRMTTVQMYNYLLSKINEDILICDFKVFHLEPNYSRIIRVLQQKKLIFIVECDENEDLLMKTLRDPKLTEHKSKLIFIMKRNDSIANTTISPIQYENFPDLQDKWILFQGKKVLMRDFLNDLSSEQRNQMIDIETIECLLKEKDMTVTIGQPLVTHESDDIPIYTERVLQSFNFLNLEKLTNMSNEETKKFYESNMLFAQFIGIPEKEERALKIELMRKYHVQLCSKIDRMNTDKPLIFLLDLSDCGKAIQHLNREVHSALITKSKGKVHCLWIKSMFLSYAGHVTIFDFIYKNRIRSIPSGSFRLFNSVTIIGDEPGMGKTTFVNHEIVTINEDAKYLWKIRINLGDQKSHLRKSNLTSKTDIIEFLVKMQIDQLNSVAKKTIDLTRTVLEQYLNRLSCNHKLLVVLDGFDEIYIDQQQKIINLIRVVSESPDEYTRYIFSRHTYVLITTRLNQVRELEHTFQSLSIKFEELNKEKQEKYLSNYWCHFRTDLNKTKVELFAKQLIDKLQFNKSNDHDLLSTPLVCNMLAKIYLPKIDQYLEENIVSYNIYTLFTEFIQTKFDIYRKKKGYEKEDPIVPTLRKKFANIHQRCSFVFLFDDNRFENVYKNLLEELEEEILDENEIRLINECGIVEIVKDDNDRALIPERIHFIHRTFAEYIVADIILNALSARNMKHTSWITYKNFLLYHLQKYESIRNFILHAQPTFEGNKVFNERWKTIKECWIILPDGDTEATCILPKASQTDEPPIESYKDIQAVYEHTSACHVQISKEKLQYIKLAFRHFRLEYSKSLTQLSIEQFERDLDYIYEALKDEKTDTKIKFESIQIICSIAQELILVWPTEKRCQMIKCIRKTIGAIRTIEPSRQLIACLGIYDVIDGINICDDNLCQLREKYSWLFSHVFPKIFDLEIISGVFDTTLDVGTSDLSLADLLAFTHKLLEKNNDDTSDDNAYAEEFRNTPEPFASLRQTVGDFTSQHAKYKSQSNAVARLSNQHEAWVFALKPMNQRMKIKQNRFYKTLLDKNINHSKFIEVFFKSNNNFNNMDSFLENFQEKLINEIDSYFAYYYTSDAALQQVTRFQFLGFSFITNCQILTQNMAKHLTRYLKNILEKPLSLAGFGISFVMWEIYKTLFEQPNQTSVMIDRDGSMDVAKYYFLLHNKYRECYLPHYGYRFKNMLDLIEESFNDNNCLDSKMNTIFLLLLFVYATRMILINNSDEQKLVITHPDNQFHQEITIKDQDKYENIINRIKAEQHTIQAKIKKKSELTVNNQTK